MKCHQFNECVYIYAFVAFSAWLMGNHSEKRSSSASFAQYQQQPVPMGGFHIKADWLHHFRQDDLPIKLD